MSQTIELTSGKKIAMREPKLRDMRMLSHVKEDEEKTIKLVANLTMMTEEELDDLSLKDYSLLQKGLESFLS